VELSGTSFLALCGTGGYSI